MNGQAEQDTYDAIRAAEREGFRQGVQAASEVCNTVCDNVKVDRDTLVTIIRVRTACREAIRALRPEGDKT